MAKIKITDNNMAMFLVCEAIGEERKEFMDIKPDDDGLYDLTITLNGKEINVVCPYDEGFSEHFRGVMAKITAHKPKEIMVDDDFRLMFREGKGCACPLHMKAFNRLAGTNMTREELYTRKFDQSVI